MAFLAALIIFGSAAPAMAQNLNEKDLLEIQQAAQRFRKEAIRQLPLMQARRTRGRACAAGGRYGLATMPKYYYSRSNHPQYYTLP